MSGQDELDRRRIAGSARAILDRTDWRHLKMRTVIKEADVSARRFYGLFANEGDLALFMLEQEFELLRQTLVTTLSAPPVGWSSIGRFADAYLDIFLDPAVEKRRRYYHAHLEGAAARRRFTSMRNQVLLPLELALAAAEGRGEIRVHDPVADARRTYNLLEGLIYVILWADHDEPAETLRSSVHSFISRALGAPDPRSVT
jgi:AcrR family transcriptional regulator